MGVDAWTEWAGSPPQAPVGLPSGPAGPGDLYDLVVTRAARLAAQPDWLRMRSPRAHPWAQSRGRRNDRRPGGCAHVRAPPPALGAATR